MPGKGRLHTASFDQRMLWMQSVEGDWGVFIEITSSIWQRCTTLVTHLHFCHMNLFPQRFIHISKHVFSSMAGNGFFHWQHSCSFQSIRFRSESIYNTVILARRIVISGDVIEMSNYIYIIHKQWLWGEKPELKGGQVSRTPIIWLGAWEKHL